MQHTVLETPTNISSQPFLAANRSTKLVTAIIPVRLSRERLYDECERIERIAKTIPRQFFSVLIVDYGTADDRRGELEDIATQYDHVDIVRVDTTAPFSIGKARDIGVQHAATKVVIFHDVDFACTASMYERIHDRAISRDLFENAYDCFCVPTVYLTQSGTIKYLAASDVHRSERADMDAHDWAVRGEEELFEHFAIGSSALVINRHAYLTLGGHDPAFIGHGAEDFEHYHRLSNFLNRGPRPEQYYDSITDPAAGYRGFRSYFSLFGLDLWVSGISMVHLHHPRREMTDESYRRSGENFKLLRSRMMEFDKVKRGLPPLADPSVSERTLLLMSPSTMPAKSLVQVLPLLGEYEFIPEDSFADPTSLISFARAREFTQLLFLNPFGNSHRQELYLKAREDGLRTIAFDRGALPESWFFDRGGFLALSSSYYRDNWDHELSSENEKSTKAWIDRFCHNGDTLEANEPRQGVEYWRRTLGIGSREVILVVFQRPADTATVFFSGAVGSTDNFTKWISTLAEHLDRRRFVIVAKKHPLEHERPDIDGVIYPRDSANINDLVEMSSIVVTINSGVGLISLIQNRPVIACGDAFYQHDGLAYAARSAEELVHLVHSRLSVSRTAVERFTSFLLNDFYSFGTAQYSTKTEANGAIRKIAYQIDFHRIANLNGKPTILGRPMARLSDKSYLMRIAGYKATPPKSPATPPKRAPASAVASVTSPAPPSRPNWSPTQKAIFKLSIATLWPALSKPDRDRLKTNPIDFFQKAKWGPNRLFGRLLVDKSKRSY